MMSYQPKVALVHDDFSQAGGAEKLFEAIAKIYPDALIYTSLVNWDKIQSNINRDRVRPSFIQKIPYAAKIYKAMLPLYPLAFESFDFSDHDLVISSTTRFAKSVVTKPKTVHISYLNSVPRFLHDDKVLSQYLPGFLKFLLQPYFSWLRQWDLASASRVDFFIANSKNVQTKIKKAYNRESEVIYPFADTTFFKPNYQTTKLPNYQTYYLIVSRLVKWKRLDIAIRTCADLNQKLIVVGSGPDEARLKNQGYTPGVQSRVRPDHTPGVNQSVEFLGDVSREQIRELYQSCKALIVTQEEDFGIAAVEAQSCGRPIIAFAKGGVPEIIIPSKTGVTFKEQTPASLKDALVASSKVKWDVAVCRKSALRFTRSLFVTQLKTAIAKYAKFN